jgi:hypothetical protein
VRRGEPELHGCGRPVNGLERGDAIRITVAGGGATLDVTIEGISDDVTVLGFWTITEATYRSAVPEVLLAQI